MDQSWCIAGDMLKVSFGVNSFSWSRWKIFVSHVLCSLAFPARFRMSTKCRKSGVKTHASYPKGTHTKHMHVPRHAGRIGTYRHSSAWIARYLGECVGLDDWLACSVQLGKNKRSISVTKAAMLLWYTIAVQSFSVLSSEGINRCYK